MRPAAATGAIRASERARRSALGHNAVVPACDKHPYPDQASARLALEKIRAKGKAKTPPLRVYPCDRCLAWHLTRHLAGKKLARWDRNPNWTRSAQEVERILRVIAEDQT